MAIIPDQKKKLFATILLTIIGMGCASSFFLFDEYINNTATVIISGCGSIIIICWLLLSHLTMSASKKHLLGTWLLISFLVLIIFGGNLLAVRNNIRIDLTQEQRHTLSKQSKSILQAIQSHIEIIAFVPLSSPEEKQLRILAESFQLETDYITISIHDPNKEPILAKQYDVQSQMELIVKKGSEERRIEEAFTEPYVLQEILSLSKGTVHDICFTTGHQELILEHYEPQTSMRTVLDKLEMQNYRAKVINLLKEQNIPDLCSTLVIAGPQLDFAAFEIELITAHLIQGKHLYALIDIGTAPLLSHSLSRFGVVLKDNAILELDPQRQVSGGDLSYSVINTSDFVPHPIIKTLATNILFQGLRSVEISEESSALSLLSLAYSSDQSWAETQYQEGPIEQTPGEDISGPVPIIAIVEGKQTSSLTDPKKTAGKMIVVGSSSLVLDEFTQRADLGNLDFFLNGISWLNNETNQLNTRARSEHIQPFLLYPNQLRIVVLVSLILTPISLLMGALGTWFLGRPSKRNTKN